MVNTLALSITMQLVIINRGITHNSKWRINSKPQIFKYKIRHKLVTTTFTVVPFYKTRSRKMDQLRIVQILRLSKWIKILLVTRWTRLLLVTRCKLIIVNRNYLHGRTLKMSRLAISLTTTLEASTSRKVEIKFFLRIITLRASHNKIYTRSRAAWRYKTRQWLRLIKGVVEWARMGSKWRMLNQWVQRWGPTTFWWVVTTSSTPIALRISQLLPIIRMKIDSWSTIIIEHGWTSILAKHQMTLIRNHLNKKIKMTFSLKKETQQTIRMEKCPRLILKQKFMAILTMMMTIRDKMLKMNN